MVSIDFSQFCDPKVNEIAVLSQRRPRDAPY